MRKWIIDFEGFAIVPAEDREQAEMLFLEHMAPSTDCPILTDNHVVTNIELYEPEAKQLSMFDEEYGH